MATCSINASSITVGAAFNVSWSGTNTGGTSRVYLSIGGYRSGDSSPRVSKQIKVLTYAASGNQNVTITASEYNSAVSDLNAAESGLTRYAIQLNYISYSDWDYDSGESSWVSISATSKCSPPSGVTLSATEVTNGDNITLKWTGAGKGGTGNTFSGYRIQYRQWDGESMGSWTNYGTDPGISAMSASVAVPGTDYFNYYYRIRTKGNAGESYWSDWVEASNNPVIRVPYLTAPTNVKVTASTPGSMTVSWTASSYSSTSGTKPTYTVTATAGSTTKTATTTGTSATLTGLTYGVKYTVTVTATIIKENKLASITYTIPTPTITTLPTITITRYYDHFHVEWTAAVGANGGSATMSYSLMYGPSGNKQQYTTAWSTSRTADVYTFTKDTTYYFVVRCSYGDYATGNSAEVSSSIPSPSLTKPTNLQVTLTNGVFHLTWDAATGSWGTGSVNYMVYYGDSETDYERYHTASQTGTSVDIKSWITGGSIQCGFQVVADYSDGTKTVYSNSDWVYKPVDYLGKPGAPVITQNGTTVTFTWTAAESASSSGVYYYVDFWRGDGSDQDDWKYVGTPTTYSVTIPSSYLGYNLVAYVIARDAPQGQSAQFAIAGDKTTKFIGVPSITAPVLSVGGQTSGTYTGQTLPISFTASSKSYITDNIVYDLYINNTLRVSNITSPKEYTKDSGVGGISITSLSGATIKIVAHVQTYSQNSNTVNYTYKPPYHTIKAYQNGGWVSCIVYAYLNGSWQLCDPYTYQNGSYRLCDHGS